MIINHKSWMPRISESFFHSDQLKIKMAGSIVVCILLFSLQIHVGYGIESSSNCSTANAFCSECYQTLVESAIRVNDNMFSLLQTFSPPNDRSPIFVIVEYKFENSSTKLTYFWTLKSSFFVIPLQIFQFMSLFFGKSSLP